MGGCGWVLTALNRWVLPLSGRAHRLTIKTIPNNPKPADPKPKTHFKKPKPNNPKSFSKTVSPRPPSLLLQTRTFASERLLGKDRKRMTGRKRIPSWKACLGPPTRKRQGAIRSDTFFRLENGAGCRTPGVKISIIFGINFRIHFCRLFNAVLAAKLAPKAGPKEAKGC